VKRFLLDYKEGKELWCITHYIFLLENHNH